MAGTLQDQVTTFFNVLGRLRPLAIVLVGTALVGTMYAAVVVRDAVEELRHQRVELLRVGAVAEPVAFEGDGDPGVVEVGLEAGALGGSLHEAVFRTQKWPEGVKPRHRH